MPSVPAAPEGCSEQDGFWHVRSPGIPSSLYPIIPPIKRDVKPDLGLRIGYVRISPWTWPVANGGSPFEAGRPILPIRPDVGADIAAGLADKPGLEIRQSHPIEPSVGIERDIEWPN